MDAPGTGNSPGIFDARRRNNSEGGGIDMRVGFIVLLVLLQIGSLVAPVGAASFDSKTIKISVDETLWDKYHMLNPATASADVEKIYKIKSIEVRLVAGDREFGSCTFTPQDKQPRKFSLLYGVAATLTIRLKAMATEDAIWISSYPYKTTGDEIVIRAVPADVTVNYPGI